MGFALMIGVVVLQCKDQVLCKLGVAEKRLDAFQHVPVMEFQVFLANNKFLALKIRAPR
jgi:hypothetical protein